MNDREDFESRLATWLAATARPLPADVRGDIVAAVHLAPQAGVRAVFPSGRRWGLAGALGVAIVLAVALGVTLRLVPNPEAGGTPATGTPVPSATAFPAPTASLPSAPRSSGPAILEWHRNNYNAGEERLFCQEGPAEWRCSYDVPDGGGVFSGQNVTSSWTCPDWFPDAACDSVVAVYRGSAVYLPADGQSSPPSEPIAQEYVLTEVDGEPVLQLYWVDRFVCPWYRTSERALAAPFSCAFIR